MREAIFGPVRGHYVLAYASPGDVKDPSFFVAGFRVYPFRPVSGRDSGHVAESECKTRYPSPEVALHHAQLKGAACVEQLACEPPC